mmetsp:Transcript_21533/g.59850  ORF Transcript_21533/g.59850 Transcript_21533/m.59850 type:complete len:476 (-) Transcript_21533:303-1730(-)
MTGSIRLGLFVGLIACSLGLCWTRQTEHLALRSENSRPLMTHTQTGSFQGGEYTGSAAVDLSEATHRRLLHGRRILQEPTDLQASSIGILPSLATGIPPDHSPHSIHQGHAHPLLTKSSPPPLRSNRSGHEAGLHSAGFFSQGGVHITTITTRTTANHSLSAEPQHEHLHPHPSAHHLQTPSQGPFVRTAGETNNATRHNPTEPLAARNPPLAAAPAALPVQLPNKPAVVLARYNEDITWVKETVRRSQKAFDVYVYQSYDKSLPNHVPNRGFEATKYLKFILDHYDNLPPKVLFLHAHQKSSHNPCAPSTFLPKWDWKSNHHHVTIPATFKTFPYSGFSKWNTIKWTDLLRYGQEIAGVTPRPYDKRNPLTLPMNAQFMVTRQRILEFPRSMYERLYKTGISECNPPQWMLEHNPDRPFIKTGCGSNRLFGLAMEISLQAILSTNMTNIRWTTGRKKGCFSVCNSKDGIWCQVK